MEEWEPSFIDLREIEARNKKNQETWVGNLDLEASSLMYAKSQVEKWLGVKLTTIELVGLRNIFQQVLKEIKKDREDNINGAIQFDAHNEVPDRFLYQFYGIVGGEDQLRKLFPPDKGKDGKMIWPTPYMYEYFKREQSKLHNEL